MIERYSRPQMTGLFTDESKYARWLEIEILAVEARVQLGHVPPEDLDEIRAKASFEPERIADLERKTRHDVAAFVDNLSESVGPAARHLHYGMTSSDVVDTALALQLRDAGGLLVRGMDGLIRVAVRLAGEHARTPMVGRTHGIHALPYSFGLKVAGWAFELDRGRARLGSAIKNVSVGKLSGAVGIYGELPPEVEAFVCERLGLGRDEASTQVVSRDRHAEFATALALVASTIDRIATEIRHLARTEVGEVQEPFAEGEQKGSSAMPHKQNPIRSERLCGLARIVRAGAVAAMESVALWHERDISNSSVERVALVDSCILLDFMIAELTEVLDEMVVWPGRMKENLRASFGLVFSERVLHALVDTGLTREEAYRVVQDAAGRAWKSRTHLEEVLRGTPEVRSHLDDSQIEQCFDESRYLDHAEIVVSRLEELRGS